MKNLVAISSRHLKERQKAELRNLLRQFCDSFNIGEGRKNRTTVVQNKIDTGDARPTRQSARRLPLTQREEPEKLIREIERERNEGSH